jgi:hypothetical protein
MSAALKPAPDKTGYTRSKPDRRRHQRVALSLNGKFLHDGADHSLRTYDLSCGGARVQAKVLPEEGSSLVCYFDDLGRVMARVVRHVEEGFAVAFEATQHKRDKLADRLVWLVNHKKYDLKDERSAPRKATGGPALVTRANGTKLQCRVIDISLTGAAFEVDGPLPVLGEYVRIGSLRGEIVRAQAHEFAIRFLHKQKA